jgi:hypothetical protein
MFSGMMGAMGGLGGVARGAAQMPGMQQQGQPGGMKSSLLQAIMQRSQPQGMAQNGPPGLQPGGPQGTDEENEIQMQMAKMNKDRQMQEMQNQMGSVGGGGGFQGSLPQGQMGGGMMEMIRRKMMAGQGGMERPLGNIGQGPMPMDPTRIPGGGIMMRPGGPGPSPEEYELYGNRPMSDFIPQGGGMLGALISRMGQQQQPQMGGSIGGGPSAMRQHPSQNPMAQQQSIGADPQAEWVQQLLAQIQNSRNQQPMY